MNKVLYYLKKKNYYYYYYYLFYYYWRFQSVWVVRVWGSGSSTGLTVLPIQDLGFNLNKREFCNVVKLRYEWPVGDITSFCVCGEVLTVDHSMICKL